jgi:hypothetical protein
MQVLDRDTHILSEAAIGAVNPHDLAFRAMASKPLKTEFTTTTGKIYFSRHPLANQFNGSLPDLAYEFMARNTLKSHISFEYLEVG